MVIVTDRQMDKYFPGMEDAHYPEVHVCYRSNTDCAIFIRATNGVVYKIYTVTLDPHVKNLDAFLDGFNDLVVWYHSSFDALSSKLSF